MVEFKPQDPDFESRIRENFALQQIMALIGARLNSVRPGAVELEFRVKPELMQQDGFVHAGIVTTIMDSASGYAAYTLMPAGSRVLSVEFKVNLLAPVIGESVIARANVKRPGKTLTVCSADAFALDGPKERLCATMLATMICLPQ